MRLYPCYAFLLLPLFAHGQNNLITQTNLRAYYDYESTSANTVTDQAGGNDNATSSAGAWTTGANPSGPGFTGNAAYDPGDGTSNRSTLLAGNALNIADNYNQHLVVPLGTAQLGTSFTLSTWHYLAPSSGNTSARFFVFEPNSGYDVSWGTGSAVGGGDSYLSYVGQVAGQSATLSRGQWHLTTHVFTTSGANTILSTYVNGNLLGTQTAPTADMSFTALNFGDARNGLSPDRDWDGMLDETAIWTRGLSAGEVASLYSLGQAGLPLAFTTEEKANNLTALGTGTSWSSSAAPAPGEVAVFNATYAQSGTLPVSAPLNLSGIQVTTGSTLIDIGNAGNAITLGPRGLDMSTAARNLTVAELTADGNQVWDVASSRTFTVGSLAGASRVYKHGAGTVVFSGDGSFSGTLHIEAGRVNAATGLALGTAGITVGQGASYSATYASGGAPFLAVTGTSNITLANNIVLPNPDSTAYYALQKSGTGSHLNLTGNISGGGANLILQLDSPTGGDSTTHFTLGGVNSMAGQVRLNRGAVTLTNASSLGSASLFVQTNTNATDGNIRFSNSFTLANNITINTGTNTISTGANNVTLSGVVTSGVAWGKVNGAGTLTLTGANSISGVVTIAAGTLELGNGGTTGSLGGSAGITNNAALRFNRSDSITVPNNIGGTGTLTQAGAGTTSLTGANNYAGTTFVSQGTLLITGSTATGGWIQVSGGATLGGSGIGGNTQVESLGRLSPGDAFANHLKLESLTLAHDSILLFDLDDRLASPPAPNPEPGYYNDHVAITGALSLNGKLRINPLSGFGTPQADDRWLLMTYFPGQLTGGTLGVDLDHSPDPGPGLIYQVDTSTPGYVYLTVAVPEASTSALLLFGLLLVGRRTALFRKISPETEGIRP